MLRPSATTPGSTFPPPANVGEGRTRLSAACWSPAGAVVAVVVGLLAGVAAAGALIVASDASGVVAAGPVAADLILLAAVVAYAAQGAARL